MQVKSITQKLDDLYEFDREPVNKKSLQGIGNFLGSFADDHRSANSIFKWKYFSYSAKLVHGCGNFNLVFKRHLLVGKKTQSS